MTNINYQNLPYSEKILTREEQRELVQKCHNACNGEREDILMRLLGSNWKFVYTQARRYFKSLDINIAMSIGFMGFIKAIDKMDLTRNTALSTVAYYWIRQELNRAANVEAYTVLIPEYIYTFISKKLKDIDKDYTYDNTHDVIVTAINESISPNEMNIYYIYNQKKVRLVHDSTDDGINNLEATYEPIDTSRPFERIDMAIDIHSAIQSIQNQRIREIMIAYFDLEEISGITLELLGIRYSLTRERIRQLIVKGKQLITEKLIDYQY